jgi:leucyl aminopeptidase
MDKALKFSVLFSFLLLFNQFAQAFEPEREATIITSNCLRTHLPDSAKVLVEGSEQIVLSLPESALESLKVKAFKHRCGGFKNISDKHNTKEQLKALLQQKSVINAPSFEHEKSVLDEQSIREHLNRIEGTRIWDTLETLTKFVDRSATTDTGLAAVHWMQTEFQTLAEQYKRDDTDSFLVSSGWFYKQPSLVSVIGKDIKADAIVIGAHIDTLSYSKPGADDDGSGSAGVLEIARVMLEGKEPLTRPVYFMWYAAEERGLVGSSHVVDYFKAEKIPVKAVLHFDMTGFRYHDKETIYLLKDNVSPELTDYVKSLIETYIGVEVGYTKCGYECSDHASWNNAMVPAACPFEADHWAGEDNPYIHSGEDTLEHVSLAHMVNFTKLGLAFALDLGTS